MGLTNNVLILIICHMLGDYFLQVDFIAKTKGDNWYHLIVHCILYLVPFIVVFGIDWRIYLLLIHHIIVDALKARYNKLNYLHDQLQHYFIIYMLYIVIGG